MEISEVIEMANPDPNAKGKPYRSEVKVSSHGIITYEICIGGNPPIYLTKEKWIVMREFINNSIEFISKNRS